MHFLKTLLFCTLLFCALPLAAQAEDPSSINKTYAISVYGGTMTNEIWYKSITGQCGFMDDHMIAAAFGWTFYRPDSQWYALELEANMAKHWGMTDHMDFNMPIVTVRWEYFPWDEVLDTNLAFGIGPSYATSKPESEIENDDDTRQFLIYWHISADFSLPDSPWALLLRLHHRSTGYGLFGHEGGGNVLTAGLRYEF